MLKARIKFRKYGMMRFIGHLDVMRFFQKAMRRAEIPIAFTSGYSPHMIMSFAQPLGVGVTSDGEYLDIELEAPISSRAAMEQLNHVMVEGMEVVNFVEVPEEKKSSGMTIVAAADYQITLLKSAKTMYESKEIPENWNAKLQDFMNQPRIIVQKKTKRSEREVDIRPMIYQMEIQDQGLHLMLAAGSEENLKPDLVMETFFRYLGCTVDEVPFHVHRNDVYAREEHTGNYVPLDALGKTIA